MFDVVINPTDDCNRGCKHCGSDAKMGGASLGLHQLERCVKELGQIMGPRNVSITGGGEPLLNPNLPALITFLLEDENNYVKLVTSGCTDENDSGYDVLEEISRISHKRLQISLSFSLYSPNCERRIRFSLPLLLENHRAIRIKVVTDLDKLRTSEELIRVLESLGFQLVWLEPRFSHHDIFTGLEDWALVGEEVCLSNLTFGKDRQPNLYYPSGRSYPFRNIVRANVGTLNFAGRASNRLHNGGIPIEEFQIRRRCPHLVHDREHISVTADGRLFPCCSFKKDGLDHMSTGTIGETSFLDALDTGFELMRKQRRYFLGYSGELPTDTCDYCRQNV